MKKKKLTLAIDLGGSCTKLIGGTDFENRLALTMEPSLSEVPPEILSSQIGLENANLEDKVWIRAEGKTYAVGYLAKALTVTHTQLTALKSTMAIPKILGGIWVLKEKLNLSNDLTVNLSCLLPPGEIKDREKIKTELEQIFSEGIDTPTGFLRLKLNYYNCLAEGSGIYLLHRSKKGKELINTSVVAVIMMGYRNVSMMVFHRGMVKEYETSNLGFVHLIKAMVKQLSGQNIERLTSALSKYRETGSEMPLHSILLTEDKQRELEELKQVEKVSQKTYDFELTNWLKEVLPIEVEEVILCGGTSDDPAVQKTLFNHFNDKNIYLHAQVEFPPDVQVLGLGNRFGDVWCLWDYAHHQLSQSKRQKIA